MSNDRLTNIFTALRPRLKALAARLLRDEADVDDALQEAFYRLWRRKADNGLSDDATKAVAMTTVRNVCIDSLRSAAAHHTDSIDDNAAADSPDLDDDDRQQRDDTLRRVNRLIDSVLSDRQREVLIMRDRNGYEMAEIAELTGMSEANVRLTLSRARKAVRQAFLNQKNV